LSVKELNKHQQQQPQKEKNNEKIELQYQHHFKRAENGSSKQ